MDSARDAYLLGQYDALIAIAQHIEQSPPTAVCDIAARQDEIKGMNIATSLIVATIVGHARDAFSRRTVAAQFDVEAEAAIRAAGSATP